LKKFRKAFGWKASSQNREKHNKLIRNSPYLSSSIEFRSRNWNRNRSSSLCWTNESKWRVRPSNRG